jgi:hypothetical protein
MVEPLISTTSTGAEGLLVLLELRLSHPSVDVFPMMLTCVGSGCYPLWFDHFVCAELDERSVCDLYQFLQYVWLQWM